LEILKGERSGVDGGVLHEGAITTSNLFWN